MPLPPITPSLPPHGHRRKNRSSEEEAYVGPAEADNVQLPSPTLTDDKTPPRSIKRMKRLRGSPDNHRPREHNGLIIERDRVGTLPLCRLPSIISVLHRSNPFMATAERIQIDVLAILHTQQIDWLTCAVVTQRWRFDPSDNDADPPLTLLVVTSLHNRGDKAAACVSLREYIKRLDTGKVLLIEIIDVKATEELLSFPIHSHEAIVAKWTAVEPKIIDVLLPTDAISFTVIRRGKEQISDDNPVTLFVSIPEESDVNWLNIREQITDVLDVARLDEVAIEVSRGTHWPQAFSSSTTAVPSSTWGPASMAGHSFSVYDCDQPATLGGFVDVQHANNQWETFAVTCHHCVFPTMKETDWMRAVKEDIQRWHESGFKPEQATQFPIRMVQPSRMDVERAVRGWKSRRKPARCAAHQLKDKLLHDKILTDLDARSLRMACSTVTYYQSKIDQAKDFVQRGQNYVGNVWATSGLRSGGTTATPWSLDWALVKVIPDRVGKNLLPSPSDIPREERDHYKVLDNPAVMPRMECFNELSLYFKHGRTSGVTCGHYSGIMQVSFKDRLRLQDNQPRDVVTWDHCIVGLNNIPFAAGGDSGSFVFDVEGQFVGMIMGADGRANTATVLSAEALVKDILDTTGARDVRLTGTQLSV